MEKITIVEIPSGKMISSGECNIGDKTFTRFYENVIAKNTDILPRDFLHHNHETGKSIWYYSVLNLDVGKIDTTGFEIIDFEGGFYAKATAIDPPDDNSASLKQTYQEIIDWVNGSKYFEIDCREERLSMQQMPAQRAKEIMGNAQTEVLIPIRPRK
jgi:hypothetical protein